MHRVDNKKKHSEINTYRLQHQQGHGLLYILKFSLPK